MDKIVNFNIAKADRENDNTCLLPSDIAQDFLASSESKWPKAIIVALDDREGQYNIHFSMANMSSSEVVALLTIKLNEFIREMRPNGN